MSRVVLLAIVISLAMAAPAQSKSPAVSTTTVSPQARIIQPLDEAQRIVLKGNTHRLARPQFDRGTAPATLPMNRMLLVLKRSPEQQAALYQLLDSQQDKSSPNYHKWLTPDQFGSEFGIADADLQIVTSWLQTHGFTVTNVAHGRSVIEFSGTAAQVQQAFGTSIHQYLVNGKQHWANATDPQVPTALAPVVAGVHSLHNFEKKPQLVVSPTKIPIAYSPTGKPQATSGTLHALSPGDYAVIYNINPLYNSGITGSGRTIAVVGRSDIFNSDIYDFQNAFGVGFSFNELFNGPGPGDVPGDDVESTLDVSWSGAVAHGANIELVISASTNTTDGIDLSRLFVVDNNVADVMSVSYGICEAALTSTELASMSMLDEQAAAEGITQTVSTGDTGSAGCDDLGENVATGPLSVNALASNPFTVAVGGTMFNDVSNPSRYWSSNQNVWTTALSYIPENVWNETCTTSCGQFQAPLAAGGGGPSSVFPKPAWQSGVPNIPADGKRDLPDVSLTASLRDGYLLCFGFSCSGQNLLFLIGGTSASAPSFAGIMALVDQKTNSRQGQANYVLYRLAAAQNNSQCNGSSTTTLPASTCVFNDVTVGNNSVPGETGYNTTNATYRSGVAYDMATGLGSVNAANLVNKWNSVAFSPTTTTLTLNSGTAVNITHGQSVPVQVTVAPQSGTGTAPSGDVALVSDIVSPLNDQGLALLTPLSSGSISSNIASLPGGSYNVYGQYSGDVKYAPSTSNKVAVTVSPEPSTTVASAMLVDQFGNTSPLTTAPYGSFIYLRADVTGQSGQGIATGTVTFLDTNNTFITYLGLNSQGNTATPQGITSLVAGSHSVTATYGGDNSFNGSSSSPVNFTLTKAVTSSDLQASSSTLGQGASITLSVTISSQSLGTYPTGTVNFLSNGAPIGSAVMVTPYFPPIPFPFAQGTATLTTSSLPLGQDNITAQYSGDTNYSASLSPATLVSVVPDFSLPQTLNPITVSRGKAGTTTLTITGQTGYSGTVSFTASSCVGLPFESTCTFNPPSVTGTGQTTITVTTTAPSAMLHSSRGLEFWASTGTLSFAGMLLIGAPIRRRRWARMFALLIFGSLLAGVGCGGGSGSSAPPPNPGTPTGTYTVTVNAVSGALAHSTTFTLTIQ